MNELAHTASSVVEGKPRDFSRDRVRRGFQGWEQCRTNEWRTKGNWTQKEERRERGHMHTQCRGPGFELVRMKMFEAGRMYAAKVPPESAAARAAHPPGSCQC